MGNPSYIGLNDIADRFPSLFRSQKYVSTVHSPYINNCQHLLKLFKTLPIKVFLFRQECKNNLNFSDNYSFTQKKEKQENFTILF